MDETAGFTWALYRGSWLPCQVMDEDRQTGTLEVRVTDRDGTHEVWLRPEQIRGFNRGSKLDAKVAPGYASTAK